MADSCFYVLVASNQKSKGSVNPDIVELFTSQIERTQCP